MMSNNSPKISVVIPLYNKEKTIKKTIESVLRQTFTDFELVIVNDGSKDKSVDIVREIDDSRIRLINQENGGVSSARNTGVKQAKGDFIFFLDADDLIHTKCFNAFGLLIDRFPNHNVYASNFWLTRNNSREVFLPVEHEYTTFYDPWKAMATDRLFLRTGNALVKRRHALKYEFNEQISLYEDFDYFLRISENQEIPFMSQCYLEYHLDNASLSITKIDVKSEFSYHATLNNRLNYRNLLIGQNIAISIFSRLKKGKREQAMLLIKRHIRHIPIILYSSLYYKLKRGKL